MIRLAVDFEHSSRLWWESGGRDLWDGLLSGVDESAIVLDDDIAESWLAEARRVPGWDAGPDFAPNPIAARRIEADDPDA